MKIVVPSKDEKLCGHFGNCEYFSFVETDPDIGKILSIEKKIPEGGVSCQSAGWIAAQGADVVLAGGMGQRPMDMFTQNGVEVIPGCEELNVETVVRQYLDNTLSRGENTCGGEHHECHHHNGEHGGCHHHS